MKEESPPPGGDQNVWRMVSDCPRFSMQAFEALLPSGNRLIATRLCGSPRGGVKEHLSLARLCERPGVRYGLTEHPKVFLRHVVRGSQSS